MNASEAIIQALENYGVEVVYGLPGVHNLPLFDALRSSARIRTVTVRNESGASFMASGYARTTWKPGVCVLAPGPGVTNAITGIAEAYIDSTPLLILSGGIQPSQVGKGAIHEGDHQSLLSTVTKWSGRADRFQEVLPALERAYGEAASGRPRPTFLEVPLGVQSSQGDEGVTFPKVEPRTTINLDKIRQAADLLLRAEAPVIIAGGGVLSAQASALVRSLSERLGIPVSTTITAKEVMPDTSPLSLGLLNDEVAMNVVPRADVVLALGCRFAQRSTSSWGLHIGGKLVHVDIDAGEIGRNYPAVIGVVGDAADFLGFLSKETEGRERLLTESRLREIGELRAVRDARYEERLASDDVPLKPQRVMRELSHVLGEDVVVTFDSGNNAWWPMMFLESRVGRRFIFPSGNVSMGFSLPAAIGARCASDRVVSITGDGGMLMQLGELATAVQEGLNVVVLVLNDGGYGAIRHYQRFNFGERYASVDLRNPDFAKVADGFGADGIGVETVDDLRSGLREALGSHQVTVLDIRIDPQEVALPSWIIQSFARAAKE
jgi:acetolactate synthase-1/2/3 large subunit